jgi:hypothetical protein
MTADCSVAVPLGRKAGAMLKQPLKVAPPKAWRVDNAYSPIPRIRR